MFQNSQIPIVITTIFPPNEVISAYVKKGHQLIVVGDKKTTSDWAHPECIYLSVQQQHNLFKSFSEKIPLNHYARKNIGYLYAMQLAEAMIETDDDNFPLKNYPNFFDQSIDTRQIASDTGFINTYELFTKQKTKRNLWPRGYPLSLLKTTTRYKSKKITKRFFIQQGLVDGDTDVDAIYRLVFDQHVQFKNRYHFALSPHTYAPINTQNTFWSREAFILLYLPVYASFRSCDIIKGWIAQRLVWELDNSVLFLSPSVFQKRNPHDYIKDFESELPLYLDTIKFVRILEDIKLSGSIEAKFIQIYQALIRDRLIDPKELPLVKAWVTAVTKILG